MDALDTALEARFDDSSKKARSGNEQYPPEEFRRAAAHAHLVTHHALEMDDADGHKLAADAHQRMADMHSAHADLYDDGDGDDDGDQDDGAKKSAGSGKVKG